MSNSLCKEHCQESRRRHRPSRRWLAALVIACCTASPAAAQSPPLKSAHLFKTANRAPKVRPESPEGAQSQSAVPAQEISPESSASQSPSSPDFGPRSPSPKSARLLDVNPHDVSSQSVNPRNANPHSSTSQPTAQPPQPARSLELGTSSAAVDAVSSPAVVTPVVPAPTADVPAPQEALDRQPPLAVPGVAPGAAENMLRLPGAGPAQGAEQPGQPEGQEDNSGGLTLDALESMALGANPSLGRASAAVAAARGAAIQAGLPFNPTVGYEGQQIGSRGLAEQHGVLVSQEFLRHEKRTLSREVACREVQMAEYRYVAQRARVLTDVRIAYFRALRAQRQIDMSAELLHISQQALKAAKALAEAKEIARTDVLQAQIEVDAAQASLDNAQNQHQAAWNQLAAVTGQSQLQVVPLTGDLFASPRELQFDEVLAWLRGQSPEIAVAIANVERARLFWQRQRVEPRPNLSVQGLYNFVDNGIGGDPDAAVAVSVPVPLYNRNQGAIQQARYEVVVAERSLAQLELALQQRLAPVYERYSNAKNLVQQYGQRILPAAAEVLQLTQKTFEVGEIGFTNLLIAQRSYRQQQLLYLEAAEALRVSESEIDGLLLSGSLTEPAQ